MISSRITNKNILSEPVCHADCAASECQSSTVSLPNARFASSRLHTDLDNPEVKISALLMQFAQFVDHDMSLSPEASTANCCKNPNQDECMAIMIPENDAYFRQLNNQTCMQFTRSVPYCPASVDSCTKRENMNIISGLLDTSNVYAQGVSEEYIGYALKGRRTDMLIGTKFGSMRRQGPNNFGVLALVVQTSNISEGIRPHPVCG